MLIFGNNFQFNSRVWSGFQILFCHFLLFQQIIYWNCRKLTTYFTTRIVLGNFILEINLKINYSFVSASHVRRVRVPSQASDVDQFLDDLFNPVLDGLSDARSLAPSTKGGTIRFVAASGWQKKIIYFRNQRTFDKLSDKISMFRSQDDFLNDIYDPLFKDSQLDSSKLAQSIKGGGKGAGGVGTQQVVP